MIPTWLEQACEEIDAGFFSGDTMDNEENRKFVKEYIDRWNRSLNEN